MVVVLAVVGIVVVVVGVVVVVVGVVEVVVVGAILVVVVVVEVDVVRLLLVGLNLGLDGLVDWTLAVVELEGGVVVVEVLTVVVDVVVVGVVVVVVEAFVVGTLAVRSLTATMSPIAIHFGFRRGILGNSESWGLVAPARGVITVGTAELADSVPGDWRVSTAVPSAVLVITAVAPAADGGAGVLIGIARVDASSSSYSITSSSYSRSVLVKFLAAALATVPLFAVWRASSCLKSSCTCASLASTAMGRN